MGQWLSSVDVVPRGNRRLHAVGTGVEYRDATERLLVETLDARDDRTVVVSWKRTYILADTMFSEFALPLPKHILEQAAADDKANFFSLPYWTTEFVGTGPFTLRDWVRNSHLVLGAFGDYALGRPQLDELEVRFFLDPNVVVANVLAGSVEELAAAGGAP